MDEVPAETLESAETPASTSWPWDLPRATLIIGSCLCFAAVVLLIRWAGAVKWRVTRHRKEAEWNTRRQAAVARIAHQFEENTRESNVNDDAGEQASAGEAAAGLDDGG